MVHEVATLKPEMLWRQFYALTRIPRPSGHEENVRAYVVSIGRRLGLETVLDDAGNVLVRKPATPGLELAPGVVLQAHLDMVPQCNSGVQHDFRHDPVDAFVDDGWVRARGTTLGADNGIGLAAGLAVLESTSLRHGPLELLCTGNEEAGMTGARGLKPGVLHGQLLLNLDSEDEGVLFVGCAGGLEGTFCFEAIKRPFSGECMAFSIMLSGLKGGHSGLDINRGRQNANRLMNRLLMEVHAAVPFRLCSIDGGGLRNAIPRESRVVLAVAADHAGVALSLLQKHAAEMAGELRETEPELRFSIEPVVLPSEALDVILTDHLLQTVADCPDGVTGMSQVMPGLVATSNNIARVILEDDRLEIRTLLRSSVTSEMDALAAVMRGVAKKEGASIRFDNGYPGWEPQSSSILVQQMRRIYRDRFGREAKIEAVHAGLECGLFGASYPKMEMLSFGPTIRFPHSPDECVDIVSVARFWEFLVATLVGLGSVSG